MYASLGTHPRVYHIYYPTPKTHKKNPPKTLVFFSLKRKIALDSDIIFAHRGSKRTPENTCTWQNALAGTSKRVSPARRIRGSASISPAPASIPHRRRWRRVPPPVRRRPRYIPISTHHKLLIQNSNYKTDNATCIKFYKQNQIPNHIPAKYSFLLLNVFRLILSIN